MVFPERVLDMPTTAVVEAATVLREELRPPQYGAQFSEDASRTFNTKYLKYKRRVERANLGGAVKYILVSMSQLVEMPVQKMLARRFFNRGSITQQQLELLLRHMLGMKRPRMIRSGVCLKGRQMPGWRKYRQGSV